MKIKTKVLLVCAILAGVILQVVMVWLGNRTLTNLVDATNKVCIGQRFSSVEEAFQAMETEAREHENTSLDTCPPYEMVHYFEYQRNTIVLFRYTTGWGKVLYLLCNLQ